MRARLLLLLAGTVLFAAVGMAGAAEAGLASQPPVVIATTPQAGEEQVDPNLPGIRIVFSKPMQTNGWSLVMIDKASFPKIAGKAGFQKDGRTFVAPVKLEAGRDYVVWINSGRYQNFRDEKGRPAVPYLLSFRTRP